MVKSLAVEYTRYDVNAHSILPSWIETPLTDGAFDFKPFAERMIPRIQARRLGKCADFKAIKA